MEILEMKNLINQIKTTESIRQKKEYQGKERSKKYYIQIAIKIKITNMTGTLGHHKETKLKNPWGRRRI
jgi:hypothetical protein